MPEQFHTFKTVETPAEGLYKEKGSKFYGYAYEVYSEEDVKGHIDTLKKEHHNARHWCYAFRLGADKKRFRANDDGEPNNSAGKPILGQIEAFDLTNTLVVVVRYFGGTKLGVGGLIQAYKAGAQEALQNGSIVEKDVTFLFRLNFPYDDMPKVMKLLKELDLKPLQQEFDLNCSLEVRVPSLHVERFRRAVEDWENVELIG